MSARTRTFVAIACALVTAMPCATIAAQPSTRRLGGVTARPWSIQLGGGLEIRARNSYEGTANRANVLAGSLGWGVNDAVGGHVKAWVFHSSASANSSSYYSKLTLTQVVVTVGADVRLTAIPGVMDLVTTAGVGVLPWIKVTVENSAPGSYVVTDQSRWACVLGAGLRFKHFVIEQSMMGFIGGSGLFPDGSVSWPIVVSVRW